MACAQLMATFSGRLLRAGIGLALIVGGISLHATSGWILAGIGAIPLAAGLFDWCPIGVLFGTPFRGRDVRQG